ncbi:Ground-like domain-containing protein [Caenorhabditis elegans]|uniref:Ground-like domain-containing protein n=1 Tax=Caenorhabditis elegans TaxID=6239 RepID=Q21183_CAEEL|nr:Ground-like domain-containing protein [Caenorhabditis elegans]CAA98506.2 Ground-like domain-containing protein [Caenorhabditis elegans]|eukprot:NP_505896.2 GRound-Like (grd related) [Caenorhabditis elegans]
MILLLLIVFIIPSVLTAPVRTELCCCGCIEEPCPLVGPSCPAPRAPCNASVETVKCSALQRLFEISQHKLFADEDDEETSTFQPTPSFDHQKTMKLLPTLNAKEVQRMKNEIMEISTNKTRKSEIRFSPPIESDRVNGLHRISHMMKEMEGMLMLMRDEISIQIENSSPVKLLEEAATRTEIDSSLHASPMTRAIRHKRAETENCNDEKLRKLIKENIRRDAKSSKREIQKAANKEFGGHFNVICSPCEFSFVVASQKYCDGFKDDVACFAFLQPPTKLKLDDE